MHAGTIEYFSPKKYYNYLQLSVLCTEYTFLKVHDNTYLIWLCMVCVGLWECQTKLCAAFIMNLATSVYRD